MNTLYVCVLVSLVACVMGQSPCCVPDQWEGVQETVLGQVQNGLGNVIRTTSGVSYDYTNRRLAAMSNITLNDNTQRQTFSLMLYEEQTAYTLDVMTGMCTKTMLPTDMKQGCIPDNARNEGRVYFGSGLVTPLVATQYSFEVPTSNLHVQGTVTVTDQCIPITESIFGHVNGVQTLQAVQFINITPGISHADVFDIPPACEKALEEFYNEEKFEGVLSV